MKGFVYFISYPESGWVKIGYARNVADRLQDLQCATPENLRVEATTPAAPAHERQIHRALRNVTRHRGEWYKRSPLVEDLIEEARRGFAAPFLVAWATARRERHLAAEDVIRGERLLSGWVSTANSKCEPGHLRNFSRDLVLQYGHGERLTKDAKAFVYKYDAPFWDAIRRRADAIRNAEIAASGPAATPRSNPIFTEEKTNG